MKPAAPVFSRLIAPFGASERPAHSRSLTSDTKQRDARFPVSHFYEKRKGGPPAARRGAHGVPISTLWSPWSCS